MNLRILSPDDVIEALDGLVVNSKLSYMDAVVHYCHQNGLEVEFVAEIVKKSARLRGRIKAEAEDANLLKGKTQRPPV